MAYTTIDDPSAHFQTTTYTGNASDGHAITNSGNSNLQPDWLWIKKRSGSGHNVLADSTRGANKQLFSSSSDAEQTSTEFIASFDSDGFTLNDNTSGTGDTNYTNGGTYVAWQWKANGGTTSSNTGGSITSTVQANTDAGFSIVTYTGNGSDNATVAHGLGKIPAMMIVKNRDDSDHWGVWHQSFAAHTSYNSLSQTIATINNDDIFKAFSSTLFTLGTDSWSNVNNEKFVVYAFAEKQGYSKMGSFIGNNSSDGAFVYLGFKPRWLMVKNVSQTHANHSWIIFDSKRETNNVIDTFLEADTTAADVTSGRNAVDFLSNGFKARESYGDFNGGSGLTFVYMAFAEHPFVSSKGVPTTAR